MESESQNWATIVPAIVLLLVAVVAIVLAGVGIARVNDYQHTFNGVDLVPVEDWTGQTADATATGQSKAKGVQAMFLAATITSLILAIPTAYAIYKMFGTSAVAIYGIFTALLLIYWLVFLYYVSNVGKNRAVDAQGDPEAATDVDVQHGLFSLANVNLALILVHAISAVCIAAYFVFSPKKKTLEGEATGILGAGRSQRCAPGDSRCPPSDNGVGRSWWQAALHGRAAHAHRH